MNPIEILSKFFHISETLVRLYGDRMDSELEPEDAIDVRILLGMQLSHVGVDMSQHEKLNYIYRQVGNKDEKISDIEGCGFPFRDHNGRRFSPIKDVPTSGRTRNCRLSNPSSDAVDFLSSLIDPNIVPDEYVDEEEDEDEYVYHYRPEGMFRSSPPHEDDIDQTLVPTDVARGYLWQIIPEKNFLFDFKVLRMLDEFRDNKHDKFFKEKAIRNLYHSQGQVSPSVVDDTLFSVGVEVTENSKEHSKLLTESHSKLLTESYERCLHSSVPKAISVVESKCPIVTKHLTWMGKSLLGQPLRERPPPRSVPAAPPGRKYTRLEDTTWNNYLADWLAANDTGRDFLKSGARSRKNNGCSSISTSTSASASISGESTAGNSHGHCGFASGSCMDGTSLGSGDFEMSCDAQNCSEVVDCTASMHTSKLELEVLVRVGGKCSGCHKTICKFHIRSHARETGCPYFATPAELEVLGFQPLPDVIDFPGRDPRDAKLLCDLWRRRALAYNLSILDKKKAPRSDIAISFAESTNGDNNEDDVEQQKTKKRKS